MFRCGQALVLQPGLSVSDAQLSLVRENVRCVCVDGTLPRRQNGTLLHEAAGNGADKLVAILLDVASLVSAETAAFLNARDDVGKTALFRAAENGHNGVLLLLLKARADAMVPSKVLDASRVKVRGPADVKVEDHVVRGPRLPDTVNGFLAGCPSAALELSGSAGRRGRRVVRTSTGIKLEVLGSGAIGFVTWGSIWAFVVETLIGLGVAFTATELLLSLAAMPSDRLRRGLAPLMGDVGAVTAALYHRGHGGEGSE